MTKLSETKILAKLEGVQAKARTRLLYDGDVANFVAMVRRARAFCKRWELPTSAIEVEINGGGVANSYRYPAETSYLRYSSDKVWTYRDNAKKGPHGNVLQRFSRIHIGSVKDHPELRKATSIERFHGGYAYLEG